MKLKMLVAAVSFSLAACVSTTPSTTKSPAVMSPTVVVKSTVDATAVNDQTITLEQIMADPDWMGRSPQAWYWGDDSQTVFYQQKRAGNPIKDLYQLDLTGNSTQVELSRLHEVSSRFAIFNQAKTQQVYLFKNNVFIKNITTGEIKQLTATSAPKSAVMFLTTGEVAYRIGNIFYAQNITTGQIKELANLTLAEKPALNEQTDSYIAKEQASLINYIALQQRNAQLQTVAEQKLVAENNTISDRKFYLGKDKKIVHASLSPSGDYLLVSIADDKPSRNSTDIMPKYIAEDGHIKAAKVRARVADNRQYKEALYLLDLTNKTKQKLAYNALPDFDKDVLAKVKAENYKREGKTYHSKSQPRNIAVIESWQPIQWNAQGDTVAIMLEAWDNKDRWLTTVQVKSPKLVTQHQLHDDAWINWDFNEFGWLNKRNSLYFLSEESGYSHLYVKPLQGKAKQLTVGNFEVSNLTLSHDEQSVYFKANKKHPGIYEIYKVNLTSAKLTQLTDLGGMNDYSLSPDNSKLLIEHSTVTMPPELYVQETKANASAKRLTYTVSKKFLSMPWAAPTVVAIPSSHQDKPIYSKVYLPKNFDKTAVKNRAVMFSHGAGYLQNSHLGWSGYFREYMFHSMLVQQGYVVIDMDYRASAGYGRDWRTAIYRHMGKPEVEDMRDGVNWLVNNAHVDRQRIGTYGGSYGGFLTLMSMFTAPDLFQSGSALRLVSDWAYYNHGYTANILNTPKDDAIAYERSSPIYFAQGLEKPLLINAPMVDDNVFFQDTVRLVQRLIELEKQDFETAIYPVERHGFVQPSSWLNEYRRIYKLFENTL
jgi:dipeptidyl aminopeptidase/acylaminoacyl peptidase